MSNLERAPREDLCTGAAAAEPWQEVLEPREVPLGGPRAMLVRRTLPHKQRRMIGAWCFLDDYGPADVVAGPGMRVPPHPHTGLQTVTWLLAGEVLHRDSVGSTQLVRPGELNLMTAGAGISHSEETPAEHSPTLRGVQLWVALPDADRHGRPHFEHHPDLPRVELTGARATVIMGSLDGAVSPARTYSRLVGAEVSVGASAVLPLQPAYEHGVLALTDGVIVDGVPVPVGTLLYLGTQRRQVTVSGPGQLLLLGGEPFEEELLMWWNFVGRSHDEIVALRAEWEAGRGSGNGSGRFGVVRGYDGPALPAPDLPTTRLKPRPRFRA